MRHRSKENVRWAGVAWVALSLLGLELSGCASSPPVKGPARPGAVTVNKGAPGTLTPEQLALSDPCAIRLHDISGEMLLFYAINRRLPEKLDELKAMADVDARVEFTCPVSGQPYQYAPQGLRSPGMTRLLVAYDATPAHDGKRWCILMAEPKPGQPLATWVEQLAEPVFRAYLPGER